MVRRRTTVPLATASALGLLTSACGLGGGSPNGAATMPPSKAETAMTAAVKKATSVRLTTEVTQNGKTATQVLDAGKTEGRQTIKISGGTATILMARKAVFVKASPSILSGNFGLPAAEASKEGGRWLTFPASSPQAQGIGPTLTVGTMSKELAVTSPKRVSHAPINGVNVVGLQGASSGGGGTLTLYVPTVGPLLPVAGTLTAPGAKVQLTFSRWGRPVSVTAPTKAAPFPVPTTSPAPASKSTSKAAAPTQG